MPENILYIILLAAGASFVQRTTGFGFGIFIMTALPFLMPSYAEAVTLSGILSLTSSTVVMLKYLKYVSWKRILPILASFLVMSALAVFMLERIEGRTMRIILGLILILLRMADRLWRDQWSDGWPFRHARPSRRTISDQLRT